MFILLFTGERGAQKYQQGPENWWVLIYTMQDWGCFQKEHEENTHSLSP